MPFKSEKQRRWMHANDPEMAKDWEKKESLKENRTKLVKNLMQVYKDLDKKFKNYDHTRIVNWGKVTRHLTKKFGGNKELASHIALSYNSYRGGEDIKKNITKLIKYTKKMTGKKLEATDSSSVPIHKTPDAFRKSTYKAIRVDDEDDSDELLGGMKDARKRMAKLDKKESVNERISVTDERHFGKKGIIIMIDDNGKKVSAIFKDKKNANKFNRNKPADIKKLLQLAKKTKYPKAIDESVNEKKNPKREKVKKDFLKSIKNLEKNVRRIKQFARANQWGPISSFVEDGLVYDIRDLEREIDQIISMPVDINESIKVRNGETAMEGKWKVYDSHSGKTIKEVGSPRAATRLMNRLMSSGQYKEITTKWVGETVNEADDHELEMAHGQLERSMEYSQMILKKLQDGGYDELPGWVQGKLTKSMDYLQSVFNYYDGKDGLDEAMTMAPFSSKEARQHINQDIKKMSKFLGKASQQSIKLMMNGVKGGKYTAMDISRGLKEGPASRTHFGELGFLQQLWNKVRDGFRRYSKDKKLS